MTLDTPARRSRQVTPATPWRNPTQLERPCFLLCFPFCYSTQVPNNLWMEDLPSDSRQPARHEGQPASQGQVRSREYAGIYQPNQRRIR